ncbi:SDR family oxidoreductase [Paraburkholderia sp. BL25I1N1]|uniref:SDR family oxidoreductase n=1 Tax=Paraburkholderia sp. BL25I1N1 TaxID=1938804 RepID=UPI000D07B89F|nr:SDR family oxidoreductase [Paraburkholderia sp. BL25I1N1]PRX96425.1 NADP-dependent 3-hydroxy acid dehydrogenase YdfG [Paraburkholderia sp. BL25I1N1]
MNYLQDKVAVITGASSGIGAATARALVAQGARVVAVARDAAEVEAFVATARQNGGEIVGHVADVTVARQMKAMAQFTKDAYGSIDILVNNAGLMLFSNWTDFATDDWEKMIEVNIKGYLNAIAAVLPFMQQQKSGHILNMDSIAGHHVVPSAGIYCATKFFVQAVTESLRKELSVHLGIRAGTISPGVVDTGWANKVSDPEGRKAAQELNKLAIAPEAVAQAVVYALNQPAMVNINDIVITPTRQDW